MVETTRPVRGRLDAVPSSATILTRCGAPCTDDSVRGVPTPVNATAEELAVPHGSGYTILSMFTLMQALLDALAPRRCAGCGMPAEGSVCEACVELCHLLAPPRSRTTGYGACHAALPFEPPVRAIVHHAKYRGHRAAAALLGALLVERLWTMLS